MGGKIGNGGIHDNLSIMGVNIQVALLVIFLLESICCGNSLEVRCFPRVRYLRKHKISPFCVSYDAIKFSVQIKLSHLLWNTKAR